MASFVVHSGVVSSGLDLGTGDLLRVLDGGEASAAVVGAGAKELISSGGLDSGATIDSGGAAYVLGGGAAYGQAIDSGGKAVVSASGVVAGELVLHGGVLEGAGEIGGGPALQLTSEDGVLDYGLVSGLGIGGPGLVGYVVVYSGGLTSRVSVDNSASFLVVFSGGSARGTTVDAGVLLVESGGSASGATILSGAVLGEQWGASVSGAIVSSGGYAVLPIEVTASEVYSEASVTVTATTVSSGARLSSGAILVQDAMIDSGATLSLTESAWLAGAQIASGARLVGSAEVTGTLVDSGTISGVSAGVSGGANATVTVYSGATIDNSFVDGTLMIVAGGTASGVTVNERPNQDGEVGVAVGAVAHHLTLIANAGSAAFEAALIQGDTFGTVISSGATEELIGVDSGTVVRTGGFAYVGLGGEAIGDVISSGGAIVDGGLIMGATVAARGYLVISGTGSAVNVNVASKGDLNVVGLVTYSGASTHTLDGTLNGGGVIVQDGPGALVRSGSDDGDFLGTLAIDAGAVDLVSAGAIGSAAIMFGSGSASETLRLEFAAALGNGKTSPNTLVDFNRSTEAIDLTEEAYVSGATATVVGHTLVLNDGGFSVTFGLGSGAAGRYKVVADTAGGTLIKPVAALAQAAAGFAVRADAHAAPSTDHIGSHSAMALAAARSRVAGST